MSNRPVLYLILCGARPARDAGRRLIEHVRERWDVCVIATPQGEKFFDATEMEALTRRKVRSDYKQPDDPDEFPPPDAVVVAPATFNTINKWASGISDTLALGVLCEALGESLPIIAAPFPNQVLARHFAFPRNVAALRGAGVRVLWAPDMYPELIPRTGARSTEMFNWDAVLNELDRIFKTVSRQDGHSHP